MTPLPAKPSFYQRYSVGIWLGLMIVGVHVGWYRLQFVEAFVSEEDRKNDKIIQNVERIKAKISSFFGSDEGGPK